MRNRYEGRDDDERYENRGRGDEDRNPDWHRREGGGDWQSRDRERYGREQYRQDDDDDRGRDEGRWRPGGARRSADPGDRDRWRSGSEIGGGRYRGDDDRYGRYGQPEGVQGGRWEDEYRSRRSEYGGRPEGSRGGYGGGSYGGRGYMGGSEGGGDRGGYGADDYGSERGRMGQGGGYGDDMSRGGRSGRQQSFRGRGPKGFTRSDERIKECVCDELEDAPDLDASEIEVTVRNGEVTLSGHVDGRHAKRLAEDIVCSVRGVKECTNQLRTSGMQSSQQQRDTSAPISSGNGNVRRTEINR